MKKKFSLIIILSTFSTSLFSFNFGVKSLSNIIKMQENEYLQDYLLSSENSFYLSQDFIFNTFFISVKPAVHITNDEVSFNFFELKLSIIFSNFALSFGKFNKYWGQSIIKNDYFPYVNEKNAAVKNLWNFNLNYFLTNLTFSAGAFFDTKEIDKLKNPEWQSYYLQTEYSLPSINIGLLCNLYDNNNITGFKTTGEIVLTYFPNFTFFIDGTFKKEDINLKENNNWSFTSGISYQKVFDFFNIYTTLEAGLDKLDLLSGLIFCLEFNNFLKFSTQIIYKNKEVIVIPRTEYDLNNFELYLEAISKNLFEERKFAFISTGISYEF